MNVHRSVRFNERVRRFFSVNERPLFNCSSIFLFRRIFSLFSQIRFLIEFSNLFNFSLVYRNQVIKRLEFRLEILFPFNLLKQVFATVKFDIDPD